MLEDKKVVVLVLNYLKTTGIEERNRARKRELEWDQKSNQVGINLLG